MHGRKKNIISSQMTSTGFRLERVILKIFLNFSSQDMYDKTAIELAKTKEVEAKLKEDFERSQFDLEMCRERFDKCQVRQLSIKQNSTTVKPCAETNTLLGSLIQLSYKGIFVSRLGIVAALSRESLVISVFFSPLYCLAMTHPS